MKRVIRIWGAILCGVLLLCPAARAAINATAEPTGGAETVYVAGNPDWYPIEYYDKETEQYEGVLPAVLERIGKETGLAFTYVRAGEGDQRFRLARNGQVELVSACRSSELGREGLTGGAAVLALPVNGSSVEVCIAFTSIAEAELTGRIERALNGLIDRELSGIVLGCLAEQTQARLPKWVIAGLAAGFALLVAVILVLTVRILKYRKAARRDKRLDPVTGIGNKAWFAERFEKYISDQYRGTYSLIFIGFDIERVNRYYGEVEAENQLRFAANELMKSTFDNEIAARVSGGGFAVARPSASEQETELWVRSLLDRLNEYCEQYGKDYRPTFCAGIYMLSASDRDSETALFNAQQGYRRARSEGTGLAFATARHAAREQETLQLKKQTLDALQNREFRMYLQLIVRTDTGEISGAEALSRWDHPEKGLLNPGSYIEMMESENTIAGLDFYIFEEACRQLEQWQRAGRRLTLSCNFTRITIGQEQFVSTLREIAGRYEFDWSALILEITEDAMENRREAAFENISRCRELGFRIALDDAGSGHTSFSDLRDYPIDIVKIDRSILNSAVNERGVALLKGMIALIHSLGMKILCEGVETRQQYELLQGLGCEYLQGYYFYRAMPREEANRLLDERDGSVERQKEKQARLRGAAPAADLVRHSDRRDDAVLPNGKRSMLRPPRQLRGTYERSDRTGYRQRQELSGVGGADARGKGSD